jgi:hypothetical protein
VAQALAPVARVAVFAGEQVEDSHN